MYRRQLGGAPMRELVEVVSASQCRQQADLYNAEARYESDVMIQTALRSMADQWLTLERQIEWVEEARSKLR